MKIKNIIKGTAIASALFLFGGSCAQAQVADGGFDSQGASVGDYCYGSACPTGSWVLPDNPQGGGTSFIRQGDGAWPAVTPVNAPMIAFIQGSSASIIRQTFTASQSGLYVVTFWLAGRQQNPNNGGNQIVSVSLSGQTVSQITLTTGAPFTRYVSSPFYLTAGASYTLQFAGGVSTDQTAFLDNVSLVQAGSSTTFGYDALGRLVHVSHTNGVNDSQNAAYAYDSAGNRQSVQVTGVP